MRVWSALKYDIKFQLRHGFYYAYALVCILYVLLLRVLPEGYRHFTATFVVFSDPAVLGFFFVGGLVLLEKGQNIYESLFVTPFKAWEYLISKVLSLSLLAIVSSLIIIVLTFGFSFNPIAFILGVFLSSTFFTLLGFTLGFLSKSINQYFILSLVYVPIFLMPLLAYFGIYDTPLFYLLPAKPALVLIQGAFKGIGIWDYAYSIAVLSIWIVIAGVWVNNWFYKYIILRIGGGGR